MGLGALHILLSPSMLRARSGSDWSEICLLLGFVLTLWDVSTHLLVDDHFEIFMQDLLGAGGHFESPLVCGRGAQTNTQNSPAHTYTSL